MGSARQEKCQPVHKSAGNNARTEGGGHPHVQVETPEMRAVFNEVKAAISDGIERGLAPRVDADYLAGVCIGVAREVGERMLERRPIDVAAAAEFAVSLILGGVPALPRQPATDPA